MKFHPAERLNMGISAGAVVAAFTIGSTHFATSLALGAALETLNLRFLHGAGEALFAGEVAGGGPWVGVLGLRLSLLCGGIAAAMWAGADPIGLVLGLSIAMPATVVAAFWNRPAVGEHELEAVPAPDDPSWDQYSVWRAGERVPHEEESK